jgi:hypothetical protein
MNVAQKNMFCSYCGKEYPARKSKKYCSTTCRVRCFEKYAEMDRVLNILTSDTFYEGYCRNTKLPKNYPKTLTAEEARAEDYKFRVANEIRNAYKENFGQEWFMDRVYPTLTEELCSFYVVELDAIFKRAVANVRERIKAEKLRQGKR